MSMALSNRILQLNFHNKLSRIFRNMRYYISIDVYGNNAVVKNTRKGKNETAIKQNYK